MNIRIKVFFHCVSGTQLLSRSHWRCHWLFAALAASSPIELYACMINGFPDERLEHYYVTVNNKNISHYVLFVFIILTINISSIKNIPPL